MVWVTSCRSVMVSSSGALASLPVTAPDAACVLRPLRCARCARRRATCKCSHVFPSRLPLQQYLSGTVGQAEPKQQSRAATTTKNRDPAPILSNALSTAACAWQPAHLNMTAVTPPPCRSATAVAHQHQHGQNDNNTGKQNGCSACRRLQSHQLKQAQQSQLCTECCQA